MDQNDLIEEADHVTSHDQSPVLRKKNKHTLLVTQAQRISALEEQVRDIPSQVLDKPLMVFSFSQVNKYAKKIEDLQVQLSSLSVAMPISRVRARASSATPTSPVHVQEPSMPTHPLAAPGLGQPFSEPESSSGVVEDTSRQTLLVSTSHDVFGTDD